MERDASTSALAQHWDARYTTVSGDRDPSWFQLRPTMSLELLRLAGAGPTNSLVDVGGGSSRLAGHLLSAGWHDVTVLDVSSEALRRSRAQADATADVAWIEADVRTWKPGRPYDVWHDRAVFHFLVAAPDRRAYLRTLAAALAPGGIVVVGTFAADGPTTCSGLPVERYDADGLVAAFGSGYEEVARRREEHRTPGGTVQPFTWVVLRDREGEP